MKFTMRNSEHGQALILLVLALTGLLGFTALTIDGGMIYSDRRIAQNAADAASLAGAGAAGNILKATSYGSWACPESAAETAAVASANSNDFGIVMVDDLSTVENGVSAICNGAEHYVDVQVKITSQTQTAFAHFVFQGVLKNTVEAVARVYGPTPVGGGKALLALDTACKKPLEGGIEFAGDLKLTIDGGAVHSNCDITTNGTKGTVEVISGTITYNQDYGTYKDNGNMVITPTVQGNSDVIDASIDAPDCDDPIMGDFTGSNVQGSIGGTTITQGKYDDISVLSTGEKLTLSPGLYCIYGNFKATGGELVGNGVTLYFPATAGTFNTQGDAKVTLTAPQPPFCEKNYPADGGCKPAIGGVLIYYEPGGTPSSPDIKLGGTSDSTYEGMIFAPNTAVNVGGSADGNDMEYGVSIIAFHIDIYGTTNINISYDADKMPQEPAWARLND